MNPRPLLHIEGLRIQSADKVLIPNLNLELNKQEVVALVGESGSGKSLTALSIMGLLPPQLNWQANCFNFEQQALDSLSSKDWQKIRGNRMGMIFQNPQSKPVYHPGTASEYCPLVPHCRRWL